MGARLFDRRGNATRAVCLMMAVTLGALHAWSGRHIMNIDGVSYLDLGDALVQGDWSSGINAHWSPLYAAMLGLVMRLAHPSGYWEFAAAHVLNFCIYIGVLAAFDFLVRELLRHKTWSGSEDELRVALPDWAWVGLAYLLFVWSSLQLIGLSVVTPDLSLAGVVFLASALVLRIHRGAWSPRTFMVLGAVLGFGYLIKAPMFPLAFVFLAVAGVATGSVRRAMPSLVAATLVYAVIAGPLVIAISVAKGRPTFGESRTLAYAWFVNKVPLRHWQGGYPGEGHPVHPTRKILDDPAVYEFAGPIRGTYPVWYDPSYWYEGIRPRFDLTAQTDTFRFNLRELADMLVSYVQGSLFVAFAALAWLGRTNGFGARDLARQWVIIVPALVAIVMYSPVSVLPRYVAPFMVLLWLGVFAAVRLTASAHSRRILAGTAIALMGALAAPIAFEIGPESADGLRALVDGEEAESHPSWHVAQGLRTLGVEPGDNVAFLHPQRQFASWAAMGSWARLARVRIVAEIPPEESPRYWSGTPEMRAQAIDAFARAGARAIVTTRIPDGSDHDGWCRIGITPYWVRMLSAAHRHHPDMPLPNTP